MFSVLTAGMLHSRSSVKKTVEKDGKYNSVAESEKELSAEQASNHEFEKFENLITLLPPLILIAGVIIMYILNKIFSN